MVAVNAPESLVAGYRRQVGRSLLVVDVRRYRSRRGAFLVAERMYLRGRWTPLVRVRLRRTRAADGGTEI